MRVVPGGPACSSLSRAPPPGASARERHNLVRLQRVPRCVYRGRMCSTNILSLITFVWCEGDRLYSFTYIVMVVSLFGNSLQMDVRCSTQALKVPVCVVCVGRGGGGREG